MRADVAFTPAQVDPQLLPSQVAVVIDVIRATSTMVEALVNGAKAIHPTSSIDDAIKLRASLGRDESLLCGERKGVAIEGFDLGNSPFEYDAETVGGKRLVMTTTNGTMALAAASAAERVYVCSLLNLTAVAEAVSEVDHLLVVCAGKEERFSLDDAVIAGHVIRQIEAHTGSLPELGDAARAAYVLAERYDPDEAFFRLTAAGSSLEEVGLGRDLASVARKDEYTLVPELRDRTVHGSSS
jgi:2-phosphosulfolactate phosphatase